MESYIVAGGGLAGLTAANALADQGARVTLLEQSERLGGRGGTQRERGYSLNFGPHALYTGGIARRTLLEWKIPISGKPPVTGDTAWLVHRGSRYPLFQGTAGLLRTKMLSWREKFEAARALGRLKPGTALTGESMERWIKRNARSERVRQVLEMLTRVTSYTADQHILDARAGLRQLALAFSQGVLYLDDGWQTMVDRLAERARSRGVVIRTGVAVEKLPDASGVILALPPAAVERITGRKLQPMRTARMATLELGLRQVPAGAATAAFGLDTPFYYSMHSAAARLAPEGASLIHVGKYLGAGQSAERAELEHFADFVLPGWRGQAELTRFLPNMVVTHAIHAIGGRPDTDALRMEGVAIAGDWVGPEGMLADAAVASGLRAAAMVKRQEARAA